MKEEQGRTPRSKELYCRKQRASSHDIIVIGRSAEIYSASKDTSRIRLLTVTGGEIGKWFPFNKKALHLYVNLTCFGQLH